MLKTLKNEKEFLSKVLSFPYKVFLAGPTYWSDIQKRTATATEYKPKVNNFVLKDKIIW